VRLRLYFYDKGPFEPDLERCQRRKHILNWMNVFLCAQVLNPGAFFMDWNVKEQLPIPRLPFKYLCHLSGGLFGTITETAWRIKHEEMA
jgi:hypothetical protein